MLQCRPVKAPQLCTLPSCPSVSSEDGELPHQLVQIEYKWLRPRLGRSIKIEEIEDQSGSADPIRSTSKIEVDRSLPDFYYRSLSIPLDHIDLLRFLSIMFGDHILANVWLFRVAEIISHYCTNFSYCCRLNVLNFSYQR